jgi:FtsH-binding integral membrane protein
MKWMIFLLFMIAAPLVVTAHDNNSGSGVDQTILIVFTGIVTYGLLLLLLMADLREWDRKYQRRLIYGAFIAATLHSFIAVVFGIIT